MRKLFLVLPAYATLMLSPAALAGDANVSFSNVEDYTDFEPANGVRDRFQQQRQDELTDYFQQLAEQLPEGQTLSVTFEDIDLTGRLEPTFGQTGSAYIRVVREIDYPAMDFDYSLNTSSGEVLREGSAELREIGFDLNRASSLRTRDERLYFEKKMLKNWFEKTFNDISDTSQPDESA